jgi:lipoprotein
MKKLFVAILVGLVAALFGAQSCSEAKVLQTEEYLIEYDETSLYVTNKNPLNFNIMLRSEDGIWKVAKLHGVYGDNKNIGVQVNNGAWATYSIWNSKYGAVYRSVWKIVYGYGFS